MGLLFIRIILIKLFYDVISGIIWKPILVIILFFYEKKKNTHKERLLLKIVYYEFMISVVSTYKSCWLMIHWNKKGPARHQPPSLYSSVSYHSDSSLKFPNNHHRFYLLYSWIICQPGVTICLFCLCTINTISSDKKW